VALNGFFQMPEVLMRYRMPGVRTNLYDDTAGRSSERCGGTFVCFACPWLEPDYQRNPTLDFQHATEVWMKLEHQELLEHGPVRPHDRTGCSRHLNAVNTVNARLVASSFAHPG
jgi:hypothetical protein